MLKPSVQIGSEMGCRERSAMLISSAFSKTKANQPIAHEKKHTIEA
jgi:hypothetical protein